MFSQVAEYIVSIERLAGKRWRRTYPAVRLLTTENKKVLKMVEVGRVSSDLSLSRYWYGKTATVDRRYRRRVELLTDLLATILFACPFSRTVDRRRQDSIACLRHLYLGETLLRTASPKTARIELLEALSKMIYPELVWYVAPAHLAIGYYEAANQHAREARFRLARVKAGREQATAVGQLLENWMLLSIQKRTPSNAAEYDKLLHNARTLLLATARRAITGPIATAAARLANTIAQQTHDVKLGLRWLDRSRDAMQKEGHFNVQAMREYHAQRLLLYDVSQDYLNGVAEAQHVVTLSAEGSVHWFTAVHVLLHLQLKSTQYAAARKTADRVLAHSEFSKQPGYLTDRIKLYALYAKVLNADKSVNMRSFVAVKRYALDVMVLRLLLAVKQQRPSQANDAMQSISRLVERTTALRRDRAFFLLSKLLALYLKHEHNLRECRKHQMFRKYETELAGFKAMQADQTVISPLSIWKAVTVHPLHK